jgi:uncharacterized protein (UPF0332 family)
MNEIDILVEKSATYMLSAAALIALKDYESAASRTYYAMFYLTQALLLTENVQVSTHLGVNNKFGLLFVKTEIFPKEFGKYLSYAAQRRSTGDYEIYNRIDQETAEDLLKTADIFNAGLKAYLMEKGFLS